MKKRKIFTISLLSFMLMFGLTGCGQANNKGENNNQVNNGNSEVVDNENKEDTGKTEVSTDGVATTLATQFKEEAKSNKDLTSLAESLGKNKTFNGVVIATMDVEEGELAGFDKEIKGFTKGVQFSPMIGTIPFIGFVFETNDTNALVKTLEENHNLRWNICTEAEEMKTEVVDNLVFFVMAPKSFAN